MTARTLNALCNAWARIADPEHWCQGVSARAANGTPVAPAAPEATRWCAVGALQLGNTLAPLERAAEALYGDTTIAAINDEIGHAAVERVYALAVAMEVGA